MDPLNLQEKFHSTRNRLFLHLRSTIRFQRSGYSEYCSEELYANFRNSLNSEASELCTKIENRYEFQPTKKFLSHSNYTKNLFTLWALEELLLNDIKSVNSLEVGSQDFSRLPALQCFLPETQITGIEIDPYPILADLHSRMDKANYFISNNNSKAEYLEANFFHLNGAYDLILCFYPFVSVNPTLAWGLPADLGDSTKWLQSIERNLKPGGHALIMHQGAWEEEEFDSARMKGNYSLQLIRRKTLECPFFYNEYTPHASVYRKE